MMWICYACVVIPWKTKQRILSDMGHVSNEDAGLAMTDVITGNEAYLSFTFITR